MVRRTREDTVSQKILRAYKVEHTLSGLYDEELGSVVENYQETTDACDTTEYEKRRAMLAMIHASR